MGSLGETLRQARLDKGVTLAEAQEHTRIRRRYLEALENEDFSSLPAPIYARGMLRTYARYLGLPPESMADLLQAARPREERLFIRPATPDAHRKLEIPLRALAVTGGAVAVVALLLIAWAQYNPLAEAIGRAEGRAGPRTQGAGPPALAAPTARPTPATVALPIATRSLPPPPTAVPTPVRGVLVEARLVAPTWVEVWVDGEKVVAERLPAGPLQPFRGERSVRMRVANGRAVEITENGQRRGVLDANDRPVEVSWTRG